MMDSRLKTQLGNYFLSDSSDLVKSNSLSLIAGVPELSYFCFNAKFTQRNAIKILHVH